MCELLLDTDVLLKFASYGLLDAIAHPGCAPGCQRRAGFVAAASFVARKRLPKKAADPDAAAARLTTFLASAVVLEPSSEELAMAADFEAAANRAGVDLDSGESQLCAVALTRGRPIILTGDKRAIIAIERLLPTIGRLTALVERVACLEQAVKLTVSRLGALVVRGLVKAEQAADKAISICFQVKSDLVPNDFQPEGLDSYIASLRREAPAVLLPGVELDVSSVP